MPLHFKLTYGKWKQRKGGPGAEQPRKGGNRICKTTPIGLCKKGAQFQALLQAPSHAARLDIFSKIIGEEQKRLAAREQLKSMFKGVGDS